MDLLNKIFFRAPKMFFAAVMSNPIGIFITSILGKWYIIVMFSAVMVAYWALKGLDKAGVLSNFTNTLTHALTDAKSIAQYCTPLIMDLRATWECISNPPSYEVSADESILQKAVDQILNIISTTNNTNNPDPTPNYITHNPNSTRNPYE